MSALVSFIIPAHNEERLIASTIDAINHVAQVLGIGHEVIVADDASTDATASLAAGVGARVVSIDRRQIAAARNAGAGAAAGDVLIFVDADTRVNPDVVAGALAALERGAVGGGATIRFDGVIPLWARVLAACFMVTMRLLMSRAAASSSAPAPPSKPPAAGTRRSSRARRSSSPAP